MPVLGNHILYKLLQYLFVSKVTNKVVALLFIDYTNSCSEFLEFFSNTSSDALRTACYDDYFILEIHFSFDILLTVNVGRMTNSYNHISTNA